MNMFKGLMSEQQTVYQLEGIVESKYQHWYLLTDIGVDKWKISEFNFE